MTFDVKLSPFHLNLDHCLSSGQVFRFERLAAGGWHGVDGGAWFVIEPAQAGWRVRSNASRAAFDRLFRLDWDTDTVHREILQAGPELRPYLEGLPGHRLMRPSNPEEVFFCFLCSANNHISRIGQMVRKLAAHGEVLDEVDSVVIHRFPSSATIADISEEHLRSQGFGYRGRSIPIAARTLADRGGIHYLEELARGPREVAREELLSIHGIGPKLADCIALFGLGFDETTPIDTHIWQALTRLYHQEWGTKALTATRYRVAASHFQERFQQRAGWAHQYLFYENVLHWRQRSLS